MAIKVVLDSMKHIFGLTEKQSNLIKEELTIDNPAYIQAKKFSKYSNTRIPKYLFYYTQERTYLTVPSGYTPPFDIDNLKDNRMEHTVSYPHFALMLRDTQKEALKHYLDDTNKGIIVLPTGKGKSILGLNIAYALRQKTLVIVHKDDLASGWKADAELCFNSKLKTGLIKSKKRVIGEQITIAMIQTLNKLSKEELDNLTQQFGLIIVDEMHHISSNSFDLLHKFNCAYKLGLSATPERSDGLTKSMYFHLGDIAYQYITTKDDKDILPVKVLIRKSTVSYFPKCVSDYNKRGNICYSIYDPNNKTHKGKPQIPINSIPREERPKIIYQDLDTKVVLDGGYMSQVCSDIHYEYTQGHSCIAFFSQKEHVRLYKDYMIDRGLEPNSIQMYYGDSKENKEEMKRKAESKEVLITLATYSIATEGTNVKAWEVCFLVSSINNEKNVEQAVGRIRRSNPNKISKAIVYDYTHPHSYIVNNHIYTRKRRYKKLDFEVIEDKPKGVMFSRGGSNR